MGHYAHGNVLGRAHANPILDTRMCQVAFAGGYVTELTANITVESMYVQCDADRNENLLLDFLIDYEKDDKAISISDHEISVWDRRVTCNSTAGWPIF